MHLKHSLLILMGVAATTAGQETLYRPVATYSIVALDEETGELGVAVQSHWFSVGTIVPWAKAGVGAVATQSFVKVEYGPEGLALMEQELTAQEALDRLVAQDPGAAVRQVGMVDARGNTAVHTGRRCIQYAGHVTGKHYTAQANLMENATVPTAMAQAFERTEGDLAERLVAALEAAQAEGGDLRGKQSAALLVVTGKPTGIPWKDVVVDLRVDDHPEPLKQLRRLLRIHRAYQHANQGDVYLEHEDVDAALKEYSAAADYYPENPELPYWAAVALAGAGRLEEALPIFKEVFARDPNLRILTPRLVPAGLLPEDPALLERIQQQ
jgi:uncharacterized Ntn-hydrolase superfamily protein